MNHLVAMIRYALPILLLTLVLLPAPEADAQQQFRGVCSKVRVELEQELTTERIGFEATLKVTNNDGADPITDFSALLTFRDIETGEDATDRFFVKPPELQNINEINGDGIIGPTKQAVAVWFIIPKITAGGENPQGREYAVGCSMSGRIRGADLGDALTAIEETITVKPEPQLEITYFQPNDVQGDDPFTPQVESPIPFVLGVLVKNGGYGIARKVNISSKQPKIVENRNRLLLVAQLLGTRVQDSPLDETTLNVNLGDIEPTRVKKGAWDMITSLSGEFVEFKASFTHSDELGGLETSVIKFVEAHFIANEVLNDEPGRDNIKDFLADVDRDSRRIPDTLYETDGAILPVNHQQTTTITGSAGANDVEVQIVSEFEGWVYMRLDDPGQALLNVARIVRNDGKVLNPCNYWTNIRYRQSDNQKLTYLNIFDRVENATQYTYSVEYAPPPEDTTPPITRLRFAGEHSEVGGIHYISPTTQLYFTSEDASPVSIEYQLNAGGFFPGLPFRLENPGTYAIEYFATDLAGNREANQTATVIIPGAEDGVNLTIAEPQIFPTDILSIRPSTTPISTTVPVNALRVDGNLKIYQGVRAFANVAGVPVSPTPRETATLTVGGQFVDFYRYRVNGGPWSTRMDVADPIELTGLPAGAVSIDVAGRNRRGPWPDASEAVRVSWVIDDTAPDVQAAGVPETPTNDDPDVTIMLTDGSASLYRWTIANGFYRAEEPLSTSIELERLTEGLHAIDIIGKRGGEWQEQVSPSKVSWTYDRSYGFDYSELPCVRTVEFPNVAGQAISFEWDGKDDGGVPQIPGIYTVYLRLVDALGNVTRTAALIEIEGVAAQEIILADSSTGAQNIRSWGNWAVWQQNDTGIWNIWARDLSNPDGETGTVQITDDEEFNQENPATDGRVVVWQGRRDDGTADIFWANLQTQETGPVTTSSDFTEANPAVDWPWVVYQVKLVDNPAVPWFIEAYNLETQERFPVSTGAGDQFRPRVHAGRVVWEDHRDVGPGEIYLADLEERTARRITNHTSGQNNPVIFGNTIAWQDNRDMDGNQVDIWKFDLLKGVEEQVTNTPYNEINPFLVGPWVTYQEDSLGAGTTENIRLMDLQTHSEVSLTRARKVFAGGSLGNGFGVWVENLGGGSRQAVASLLPGLQPVMNTANALAVTPELVNKFDSAFDLLVNWGPTAGVSAVTTYESFAPLTSRQATFAGAPSGDDFPLVAGSFLWVEFGQRNMVDLGPGGTDSIDLSAGFNAFSHTGIPVNYTAYDLIASLGAENVSSFRFFDAFAGQWRSVEVSEGEQLVGPNFSLPRVSMLVLEMRNAVSEWKP